jgi:hypothetical protein
MGPEATLHAFLAHGRVPIEEIPAKAEALFIDLKKGIDIDRVTVSLEKEGAQLFSDSFYSLPKEIAAKRDSL